MRLIIRGRNIAAYAPLIFVYGAVVHLLLFRWYVHAAYSPPSDRAFADHPLTNIGVALLGGASVALFMLALLRRTLTSDSVQSLRVVFKGGLYGVLATSIALETFFLLASVYLASWMRPGDSGASWWSVFMFFLISMQTYGTDLLVRAVPCALVYGSIGGVFALWLRKLRAPLQVRPSR